MSLYPMPMRSYVADGRSAAAVSMGQVRQVAPLATTPPHALTDTAWSATDWSDGVTNEHSGPAAWGRAQQP